ncbi:MAG: hypothetical protein HKN82_13750 [Akkermansiaceae bacterium]|nr:hypothetical protein [Akkermansiaceae bacterium]NNM28786.1 hypothetical protein [Akkermansiaceae bacterium]
MSAESFTLACSTCANNFAEGGGNAAGLAILFLLGVIVPVMVAIGFFMVRIARREQAALDPEFRDDIPVQNSQESLS